jgi:hypothetical protein
MQRGTGSGPGPWRRTWRGCAGGSARWSNGLVEIHRKRFASNGLEFLLGEGRFVAPRTIEVRLAAGGTRRVEAERVFLDLGTHATVPDISGLADAAPLTHVEALELDRLPEHLIVLGGHLPNFMPGMAGRRSRRNGCFCCRRWAIDARTVASCGRCQLLDIRSHDDHWTKCRHPETVHNTVSSYDCTVR